MKKSYQKHVWFFALTVFFLGMTSPVAGTTIQLYPDADTFISSNYPDKNYGGSTALLVGKPSSGGNRQARIRFSGIPSGATINSATLRLYCYTGNGAFTLAVQSASRSWSENTLTYNTDGSTNRWTAPKSTYYMSNITGYLSVDVTTHVQEWADGTRSNYGFHLSTNEPWNVDPGNDRGFYSREYSSTSYRPRLEIVYTTNHADLAPYKFSNWDDTIVVSPTSGTHSDGTIYVNQTAYVDYSFSNYSIEVDAQSGSYVEIWDDTTGQLILRQQQGLLPANTAFGRSDHEWTFTQNGLHTIRMKIDADDDIDEGSNEDNNEYTRTVYINMSPAQPQILSVDYDPDAAFEGEWFDIDIEVKNIGGTSPEGGISLSIPSFNDLADDSLIYNDGSSSGASEYYIDPEKMKGSTIYDKNGDQIRASYLLAEFVDNDWQSNEINYLKVKVKPKGSGSFTFYVRSAMKTTGGDWINDPQSSSVVDQQDWPVQEHSVNVKPYTSIHTNPVGAKLYVDGDLKATTPYGAYWFEAGMTILLTKDDYQDYEYTLQESDIGESLSFDLVPIGPVSIILTPPFTGATYSQMEVEGPHIGLRVVGSSPSSLPPESGGIKHRSVLTAYLAGASTWTVEDSIKLGISVPRSGRYKISFKGNVNGYIRDAGLVGIDSCMHLIRVGGRIVGHRGASHEIYNSFDQDIPTGFLWFTWNAAKGIIGVVWPGAWVSYIMEGVDVIEFLLVLEDAVVPTEVFHDVPIGFGQLSFYADLEAGQEYEFEFFVKSSTVGGVSGGLLTSGIEIQADLDEVLIQEENFVTGPIIDVIPADFLDMEYADIGQLLIKNDAFNIKNIGDQHLEGNVSIESGPFEIIAGSSYTLAPNQEQNVSISFLSQVSGTFQRKLIFTGGGDAERYVRCEAKELNPVLFVAPNNSDVDHNSGTVNFLVSNTGGGTMPWTAQVIDGGSWLSIISGDIGTNNGTITASYNANSGVTSRTGTIRVTASGANGSPKDVTVTQQGSGPHEPFFEDFETCDFSRHPWQQGGDAPWTITSDAYKGACAARSGIISDDQQSSIELTKNVPTGYITFWRKVSSEEQYDWLIFYIDDCLAGLWSGEKDWAKKSYFIEEGTHTFKWAYEKNVSLSSGSDCGWIDDIVFEPEPVDCVLYRWADFHAYCILTSDLTVAPNSYFAYDWYYEDHWLIYGSGGGFTATFNSPADRQFELVVRHLSSASAGCPGGGYSPVTIKLNGDNIVSCYDPAENHGGTHGFVTDTWLIPVTAGTNTLEWIACDLCTNYWIQGIEIRYPKELEGDLDCDSVVYFDDVGMLTGYWLEDCATPNWCGGRDIDKSGSVNFTDFAELSNHWLQATAP